MQTTTNFSYRRLRFFFRFCWISVIEWHGEFRFLNFDHCVSRRIHEDTRKWIDWNTCGWLKVSCRTCKSGISFAYAICPVAFLANASLPCLIHRSKHDTWSHQSRIIATRGLRCKAKYYEMKRTLHKWVAIYTRILSCPRIYNARSLKPSACLSTLGCLLCAANLS